MNEQDVLQKLNTAVTHATPNQLDDILSRCTERKGTVIPMTNHKTKKHWLRYAVAACLSLILVGAAAGGFLLHQARTVTSVVSLDVNPSIQLQVNSSEKVLQVQALNAEAQEVLADMPLEGTHLNVAVNAIVGSLLQHGYLDSISSAILISVEDADIQRASRLQQELTDQVGAALLNQQSQASILSQTLTSDQQLQDQAAQNNISVGKAALIQTIQQNGDFTFDQLAALSVEELSQMAKSQASQMPIGRDEALEIAKTHAGLTDTGLTWEVDPELDEVPPHYEVELHQGGQEYEYKIQAYTGEVLYSNTQQDDDDDSAPAVTGTTDIGTEKAKSIALEAAGVTASQVRNLRVERDYDDGQLEYEIEFYVGSTEYDYVISGVDGTILEQDVEQEGGSHTTQPTQPSTGSDIGAEKAKSIALSHAGFTASQVQRLKVEKDYDDGRLEYEVEFYAGSTEYDYTISGTDGTILKQDKEEHGGSQTTQPSAGSDIGAEKAKSIALSDAGFTASQVQNLQVEKDNDDGRLEYEVEFRVNGTEYEYTISAADGTILERDIDKD
ncbi:MAG TPA: PepSY domain-containing protein [Candidatus Faecousia excrementipullorum]|nr:PepSY domain-containing protein [Candidatus Faecousia excrementipullorum]